MYTRMIIGECISEEQVKEFSATYGKLDVSDACTGFVSSQLLTEDGGNMVLVLTEWDTRENCLRYHSSRAYRQFVAATQHLLVGEFVIKLFTSTAMRTVSL